MLEAGRNRRLKHVVCAEARRRVFGQAEALEQPLQREVNV